MDIFRRFINEAINKRPILNVIGDCMLDVIINVKSRYNPESAVPAYTIVSEPIFLPGGAANVAFCLSKLPADILLYGSFDEHAAKIYNQNNIECSKIFTNVKTPKKIRYIAEDQLIIRIDDESELPPIGACFRSSDINIISDYNKGTLRNLTIAGCGGKAVVDAKPSNIVSWATADTIKLNEKEADEVLSRVHSSHRSNHDDLRIIKRYVDCLNLLVTRGGGGVSLLAEEFKEFQANTGHVASIVGAGDCFIGVYAYARALNFNSVESCILANHAAGKYVRNNNRRPVELSDFIIDKVIDDIKILTNRDFNLVFTNGCFDVLHAGHIECLRFAKSKGDKLIVAVNDDDSIRRLKGQDRPINNLEDRIKTLAALEMVDYIIPFADDTPYELIKEIRPEALVKGSPYNIEDIVGHDLVSNTHVFDKYKCLSSTSILKGIRR